ncbi:hypothetical protein HHK36_001050 [Tetracentron sinense]|uniref:Uncharacterized protein n=1 Tax=Tetracentron sinense TaxID=13715 RepID=A0A835DUE7_TETSI|nr:hypothetical protein HHK36_001050 [Tetracentron sinense]
MHRCHPDISGRQIKVGCQERLGIVGNCRHPPSALRMDSPTLEQRPPAQKDGVLPDVLTEFVVDMKCDGVRGVEMDLSNQVVRVLGSLSAKIMSDALEQTGQKEPAKGPLRIEDSFSGLSRVWRFDKWSIYHWESVRSNNQVTAKEDKSDPGIVAAVIAGAEELVIVRSGGVGENYKKICTCDGMAIWESSNTDFVASTV